MYTICSALEQLAHCKWLADCQSKDQDSPKDEATKELTASAKQSDAPKPQSSCCWTFDPRLQLPHQP